MTLLGTMRLRARHELEPIHTLRTIASPQPGVSQIGLLAGQISARVSDRVHEAARQ